VKAAAIAIARGGRGAAPRPGGTPQNGARQAPMPEQSEVERTSTTQPRAWAIDAVQPPAAHTGPLGNDAARSSGTSGPLSWVPGASPAASLDWAEDVMEISEVEASGTAPHVAV